jgi:hypothetical protein
MLQRQQTGIFCQRQPSFGKLHIFTAEGNEKVKIKNMRMNLYFSYASLIKEKKRV